MEGQLILTTPSQLKTLLVEAVSIALKYYQPPSGSSESEIEPYGDFKWLESICSGVPASTLRIKSAAGEIPGVIKFGKRVLYEKAVVLNWLQSQTSKPIDSVGIEQQAERQFDTRIANNRRGGRRVA